MKKNKPCLIISKPGEDRNRPQLGHIGESLKGRKNIYLSQKTKNKGFYDDIDKDIYNIVGKNVDKNLISMNNENFSIFAKEESLALEIAQGLDDKENIRAYLSLCRKYPESLIRKIYGEVKEIPINKIKKSRGALFTYLLKNTDGKSFSSRS